ncbi:NADPH:quinone oxidoreductase [Babesia caballi]|uniref:NADPH:quinone oxidoreductase n=1 Tax=Babesia caballi TaxID=5871 RepID=A0AAV4LLR2_BABCB|nr:NADPH:quinone oxidoreductase [Babesia caballi]
MGGVGAVDRTRELARLPDNDQTAAKLVGQRSSEGDTAELQGGNVVDTLRVPLPDALGHDLDGLTELVGVLEQGHDVNKPDPGLEVSEPPEVLLGELEGLGDHAAGDEEEESHNVHHFGCRRL